MPAPIITPGIVCEFTQREQLVRFFVADMADVVQNHHANGTFYEREELAIIEKHFTPGQAYLDIGANVGNHIVFMAKVLKAGAILAVEPNPTTQKLLHLNLILNSINATLFTVAFSDHDGMAKMAWVNHNLGGARIFEEPDGTVKMRRGDDVLGNRKVDFIKIDVEASEVGVLAGLEQTIARNRPRMFVEVDNANMGAVTDWIEAHDYEIKERFRRYKVADNLMIAPRGS